MSGGLIGRSLDNHRWISFTLLACMKNLVYQCTSKDIQLLIVDTRDAADYGNSQHASKHVDKCNVLLTNLFTRTDVEYCLGICYTTSHAPTEIY